MVVLVVSDSEVVHILQFDDLAWLEGWLAEVGAVRTAESVAQTALKLKRNTSVNKIEKIENLKPREVIMEKDSLPYQTSHSFVVVTSK